jgi:hypothetical protein
MADDEHYFYDWSETRTSHEEGQTRTTSQNEKHVLLLYPCFIYD